MKNKEVHIAFFSFFVNHEKMLSRAVFRTSSNATRWGRRQTCPLFHPQSFRDTGL